MSVEKQTSVSLPSVAEDDRSRSPSATGVRRQPPPRSFTVHDTAKGPGVRRGSFLSDTLSESRRSFRSSTDDLLLPRVYDAAATQDDHADTSHWHSAPLVLALLPAVAGLFFKDGSAIITDVTLLGLAAIMLNWSLQLPWQWYRSAQAVAFDSSRPATPVDLDEREVGVSLVDQDDKTHRQGGPSADDSLPVDPPTNVTLSEAQMAAQQELRVHELVALLACFFSPLGGAWLLHAIRSQLSRPSEGLVSNYNLTIFLLVAELRPLSHLAKMIQRRTLFLQRRAGVENLHNLKSGNERTLEDLTNRLDELEGLVTGTMNASTTESLAQSLESSDILISKASSQAIYDLRKTMQPELDALNRAMRRYEKRMTISAVQVEARLQELETRLKDVVALAAAAQRSAESQRRNYVMVLTNWLCAMVVVPVEMLVEATKIPGKTLKVLLAWVADQLKLPRRRAGSKDSRVGTRKAPRAPLNAKGNKSVS